ncbi:cation diffusion facilitator family transporter [Sulfurospirillum sp.]|uniref:cation diffusion facilitator family transporter n=1 Tax=Sulfurospirillum sp. TaxID=2053622 RepID=UPI002FDD2EEF
MTLQKKATVVSSATATLLIVIKLFIGIMSGSVAVLASAIDSVLDLIVSAFNYFAITKAEQPANKKFNYGKGKIEALAGVIEGTVITVSGLFIFYTSIKKAINQEPIEFLGYSVIVMLVSLVITIALVLFLNYVAKKTHSMVVKSDALHYKTDVLSNGAILISLVLIQVTGFEMIDSIMGVVISIYIIHSAYEIIRDGVYILLDASLDEEIVESIKNIIIGEKEISDFHYLKTRKSANTNFVDVHLVFSPGISLMRAHHAGDRIEESIKELIPDGEWVINAHLDPYDDSEMNDKTAKKMD